MKVSIPTSIYGKHEEAEVAGFVVIKDKPHAIVILGTKLVHVPIDEVNVIKHK